MDCGSWKRIHQCLRDLVSQHEMVTNFWDLRLQLGIAHQMFCSRSLLLFISDKIAVSLSMTAIDLTADVTNLATFSA